MAFQVLRPEGTGRFVILCDHASNRVPPELEQLGLTPDQLSEHIAWDIGAAGIAAELSSIFDATTVLASQSRLVVDCNRQLTAPDLIPEQSHGTWIPGNQNLTDAAKLARLDRWFHPYHAAIETILTDRIAHERPTTVLSIHSMTASLAGIDRPWQIAISSHLDRSLAESILTALRRPGDIVVGDNQPYDLDPDVDFSVPYHAMRRNLRYVQVEFRQDEVSTQKDQSYWARRFSEALAEVL